MDSLYTLRQKHPTIADRYEELLKKMSAIFGEKSVRYGIGNITNGGSLDKDEDVHFMLLGLWFRMQDKLNRLKEIIRNPELSAGTDESVTDTLSDLANYAIIAHIVSDRKWK